MRASFWRARRALRDCLFRFSKEPSMWLVNDQIRGYLELVILLGGTFKELIGGWVWGTGDRFGYDMHAQVPGTSRHRDTRNWEQTSWSGSIKTSVNPAIRASFWCAGRALHGCRFTFSDRALDVAGDCNWRYFPAPSVTYYTWPRTDGLVWGLAVNPA